MTTGLRARSRNALLSGPTLAAFRIPGFPIVWLAGVASAFGWSVSTVAVGWITLQVSNSPFAVGATFAARLLPALVFGIPLGSLVDRFDRRLILVTVNVIGALALIGVAAIASAGDLTLVALLALSFGLGVIDTTRGTAFQSYAFDLAGSDGATNAIALANLGGALAGIAGSFAGGVVLDNAGVPPTFTMAGLFALLAAGGLVLSGRHARRAPAVPRLVPSFRRSLTLIARNRTIAIVAFVVLVNEMLGFAAITLLPTFARDVLHGDASALGSLSAVRSVGSVIGLLFLARIGMRSRGRTLLNLATLVSGMALVAFALSTSFALSLLLIAIVGLAWGSLDTLGQSLMQRSVDDAERGAAMGIWFFAIGFGPFGHLGLGAAASAFGAPATLAVDGAILAAFAVLFLVSRGLRQPD